MLVRLYAGEIILGKFQLENVPNISNLREVVSQLLNT